jgi:predicted nucleic acid-binding OB-fold protein
MATKSFYETLELETREQIEMVTRLIEEADLRPHAHIDAPDVVRKIEEGNRLVDEGYFGRLIS